MEVILKLTPVMSLTLAFVSLIHERLWSVLPASPYFSSLGHSLLTVLIIAAGGLIAFFMVWAEFALISHTSALTFMVAGTFKEIVTVAAAVLFLGETFTLVNAAGLVVLIAGVALFNWQKYKKLREQELARMRVMEYDEEDHDDEEGARPAEAQQRLIGPMKLGDSNSPVSLERARLSGEDGVARESPRVSSSRGEHHTASGLIGSSGPIQKASAL